MINKTRILDLIDLASLYLLETSEKEMALLTI
jgi:hypothetical protein